MVYQRSFIKNFELKNTSTKLTMFMENLLNLSETKSRQLEFS